MKPLITISFVLFLLYAGCIYKCSSQDLTYQDSIKSYNKRISYYSRHNKKLMLRQIKFRDELVLKHKKR